MGFAFRSRRAPYIGIALLVLLSILSGMVESVGGQSAGVAAAERPNIILIVTDDLDSRSLDLMPSIDALLRQEGTTFANFMVSMPACCPSRASILRGQYVHNHGVTGNTAPNGGFEAFYELGREESTLATWLHNAGYRTGLFGKYLNEYEKVPTHRPPGWDDWRAWAGKGKYFGYLLNENGQLVRYRSRDGQYETDVLAERARQFVADSVATGVPFFAYIAPHAPHEPNVPAPRHEEAFFDATAPRLPSFNEADLVDKPAWMRDVPPLSLEEVAHIDALYRRRLQAMLAVDEMVASLVATLSETGELANTYIFFTSDNGWQLGEHRLADGKGTPYEEAIRVPLLVRGPGMPAGRIETRIASNIDLAPTIAELAGATRPAFVDGRSLRPLLQGDETTPWRHAVLVEMISWTPNRPEIKLAAGYQPGAKQEDPKGVDWDRSRPTTFRVLRTADLAYIEYEQTGDRELYDLRSDPFQLENLIHRADPEMQTSLSRSLAALAACAVESCRTTEDARLELSGDGAEVESDARP